MPRAPDEASIGFETTSRTGTHAGGGKADHCLNARVLESAYGKKLSLAGNANNHQENSRNKNIRTFTEADSVTTCQESCGRDQLVEYLGVASRGYWPIIKVTSNA